MMRPNQELYQKIITNLVLKNIFLQPNGEYYFFREDLMPYIGNYGGEWRQHLNYSDLWKVSSTCMDLVGPFGMVNLTHSLLIWCGHSIYSLIMMVMK